MLRVFFGKQNEDKLVSLLRAVFMFGKQGCCVRLKKESKVNGLFGLMPRVNNLAEKMSRYK